MIQAFNDRTENVCACSPRHRSASCRSWHQGEASMLLHRSLQIGLLGLTLATMSSNAFAQTPIGPTERQPTAAQAAQQDRMRSCNIDAGTRNLAGDARRTFMRECLAGRSAPTRPQPNAAQTAQRERMTSCNAEASTRNFAIDARRSFMSDCLAGRTPLPATPAPRR